MTHQPGDDVRLSHSGRFAARDIVQFVPFARFSSSPALLAQETLAEIAQAIDGAKNYVRAAELLRGLLFIEKFAIELDDAIDALV